MELLVIVAEIHSCSFPFVLLRGKSTVHELHSLAHLRTHIRKYPNKLRILNARVAIEKTVQLFAVSVKIDDKPYFSLLAEFQYKTLNRCDFRNIKLFLSGVPLPV